MRRADHRQYHRCRRPATALAPRPAPSPPLTPPNPNPRPQVPFRARSAVAVPVCVGRDGTDAPRHTTHYDRERCVGGGKEGEREGGGGGLARKPRLVPTDRLTAANSHTNCTHSPPLVPTTPTDSPGIDLFGAETALGILHFLDGTIPMSARWAAAAERRAEAAIGDEGGPAGLGQGQRAGEGRLAWFT